MDIGLRARAAVLTCGGLAAAALIAPAAHAAGVAGGRTTVVLDRQASAHVRLSARKPARLHGRKLVLPVRGGRLAFATGAGSVDHRGALRLASGKRKVTLSSFRLARSTLSAKVRGKRLAIAKLSGAKYAPGPTGATVRGARLTLTVRAARALDEALRTSAFKRGMRLGTVSAVFARKLRIESGTTTLALDPNTSKAFAANGVRVGVVAPSTMTASGITFPVSGGSLNAKTLAGTITHGGGLTLTKGGTSASLTRPNVGLGKRSSFSVVVGSFGRQPVANVDLSGATITPQLTATRGSITVTGAAVRLTPAAASLLGAQFGVQLPPNTPLGTLSATLQVG